MANITADVGTTVVKPNTSVFYHVIKRLTDLILSSIGLIVLSPIFLVTALAIKLDDPGPAFFMQDRNGLNGKVYHANMSQLLNFGTIW